MKTMKKMVTIALICTMTLFNVLLIGMKIVSASEEEQALEEENPQVPTIQLEQNVEKYYNVAEDQALLQQQVIVNRQGENKLEREDLEVTSPIIQGKNAEVVIVLLNGNKLSEDSYSYDVQTGMLNLSISNEEQLAYFNNSQDIYQIIYGYLEVQEVGTEVVTLKTTLNSKYENIDQITTQKEDTIEISPIGQSISISGEITERVAKGYLYQGNQRDTEFDEKYKIEISNLQGFDNIIVNNTEENYSYMDNEETFFSSAEGNTYFKTTSISKDGMLKLLGENGIITFKDLNGNILSEINKDTQVDENGNINIGYPENITNKIQIEMTKPVQEGTIEINHKKAFKAQTGYLVGDLQRSTGYEEKVVANGIETVLRMNLVEPTLQADFQVNKTDLSTMQSNQELEIKLILKSVDNYMKLYNNPLIQVTLPEEIETIDIQDGVNLLYENEMSIANTWVDGKTIYIQLAGQQTIYKEQAVQGAEINFKVNVTLNKKATNASREIIAQVINQGDNDTIEMRSGIKIVSPRDIIAINKVESMGIEAYGEEENLEASLERHTDEKQVEIKSEIINSKEDVNNVRILGKIPTNGNENNLNANIVSPVSVEGTDARVYYTENENADENLDNTENGWIEDFTNIAQPRKYLLVIDQMPQATVINTSYTISVPADLEYNQEATEGYSVIYTSSATNISNSVKATDVTLTTGQGPILETELSATVGNDTLSTGSIVKVGEVVKYTVKVTNTGTEEARDVNVTAQVPEGMMLVQEKPAMTDGEDANTSVEDRGYVYGEGFYYELQDESFNGTIDSIGIGETKEIDIFLRAVNVAQNVNVKAQIQYGEDTDETEEVSISTEENGLQVYIKSVDDPSTMYQNGTSAKYFIGIKNITDKVQNNISVNLNIPEYMQLMRAYIGEDELNIEENIVIESIQPQEEITLVAMFSIGNFDEDIASIPMSVVLVNEAQNQTRSNVFYRDAYKAEIDLSLTTTNEGGYVKTDDIIEYKIQLTNVGKIDVGHLVVHDAISNELTILDVQENGESIEFSGNDLTIYTNIAQGETKEIVIRTVVNYSDTRTEDVDIINKVQILLNGELYKEAQVMHTVEASRTNSEDPNNPDNPNNPQKGYTIRGYAWLDQNEDGRMQQAEERFSDMNVMLLNVATNELVKDANGNNLVVTTGSVGEYSFTDLENGNYIVIFEYDTSRYSLSPYQKSGVNDSENSDVISRTMNINGTEKTYAVTDTIEITDRSMANINIGLIELDEADLKIDKYVKRIITQSSSGTDVVTYNNDTNLGRVEIDARRVNSTNLVIEYEIRVTNVGEVEAYARRLVDQLPDGLTFNSELNKDWYQTGDNLYNISLSNEKISAGESKSVTLTLTKSMSANTTGTYTNIAKIAESFNETGVADSNSNNDSSNADVIVSIRTGAIFGYTTLILSGIMIIATGVYFIKKKVLDTKM